MTNPVLSPRDLGSTEGRYPQRQESSSCQNSLKAVDLFHAGFMLGAGACLGGLAISLVLGHPIFFTAIVITGLVAKWLGSHE